MFWRGIAEDVFRCFLNRRSTCSGLILYFVKCKNDCFFKTLWSVHFLLFSSFALFDNGLVWFLGLWTLTPYHVSFRGRTQEGAALNLGFCIHLTKVSFISTKPIHIRVKVRGEMHDGSSLTGQASGQKDTILCWKLNWDHHDVRDVFLT